MEGLRTYEITYYRQCTQQRSQPPRSVCGFLDVHRLLIPFQHGFAPVSGRPIINTSLLQGDIPAKSPGAYPIARKNEVSYGVCLMNFRKAFYLTPYILKAEHLYIGHLHIKRKSE